MSRLLFLSRLDSLTKVSQVIEPFKVIHKVKLEPPNNIGGVLDIATLLETLKGNGLSVVEPIETADNDKGGVGVALELFELANGIINAELSGFAT